MLVDPAADHPDPDLPALGGADGKLQLDGGVVCERSLEAFRQRRPVVLADKLEVRAGADLNVLVDVMDLSGDAAPDEAALVRHIHPSAHLGDIRHHLQKFLAGDGLGRRAGEGGGGAGEGGSGAE